MYISKSKFCLKEKSSKFKAEAKNAQYAVYQYTSPANGCKHLTHTLDM